VTAALFDLRPSAWSATLFLVGWGAGWLLLWRARPLAAASPPAGSPARPSVAVVVPARDEAHAIAGVVGGVLPQLRAGDDLVVVDDRSADATAAVAAATGARVLTAPEPGPGWLGKPHACAVGAAACHQDVLVFLDADVAPAPDLVDRLVAAVSAAPGTLVSVQPWHRTVGAVEQLSMLFNVVAVMGTTAFTPLGPRLAPRLAFGPVLACRRADYEQVGGHAAPAVRSAVAEDIALGRQFDRVALHTGRPDTTFRMYPGGLLDLCRGWAKNIATGARHTRWWFNVAIVVWIWSLCGGWLASPWFYAATVVQLAVLARRVGSFTWPVVVHPVATLLFLGVFLVSVARMVTNRPVRWKGRPVRPR
jgi:4,4'-diaponeurosporenoate glycosyltransferase